MPCIISFSLYHFCTLISDVISLFWESWRALWQGPGEPYTLRKVHWIILGVTPGAHVQRFTFAVQTILLAGLSFFFSVTDKIATRKGISL